MCMCMPMLHAHVHANDMCMCMCMYGDNWHVAAKISRAVDVGVQVQSMPASRVS